MIKRTGSEIIVHMLERQGIRTVAGIPGGANLPIYDALAKSDPIRHVLARHEQGAGFMAQGMARVTRRPGVCLATSGPGATNVLTAVADAKLDSVPLVCITGQVPRDMIGTDAFQEVDIYGMSIPVTKHNFLVRSGEELLRVIPEAFRIAASGRPGPVLIDVPKDVQSREIAFEAWPEPGRPDPCPPVDTRDLTRAAAMINAAARPVLYVGGGVVQSGASALAGALARKAAIPTTMSLMGLGVLPSDHPLALGMLGMHAARFTNLVLEECDLLIAAGTRFDDRATGRVGAFCPQADIVHIDIDPCEVHKIKRAHVGLVGDVGDVLEALLPMVEGRTGEEWLGRVSCLKDLFPMAFPDSGPGFSPHGLIARAAELLDEDAVIVTDVGQHQMWIAQTYPFRRPGQLLTSGGLGTMGFGMPVAIGAALAEPGRRVVCFSGDGSLLMNIQEMATAVEEQIDITVVLMNNNALGLVRQQQELFYGNRIFASDYRTAVDFVRVAEGFGVRAFDLAEEGDVSGALRRAFEERGPCLIHAPIDAHEMVYPMVPPGAANRDMIGGECHVVTGN